MGQKNTKQTVYSAGDVVLSKELWFFNKNTSVQDVSYGDNSVKLVLKKIEKEELFYFMFGNAVIQPKTIKNLVWIEAENYELSIEMAKSNTVDVRFFIQQFDTSNKVHAKVYELKNGDNRIAFVREGEAKYIKLLLRIAHSDAGSVSFSNIAMKVVKVQKNGQKESIQITSSPLKNFKKGNLLLDEPFIYDAYVQYECFVKNLKIDILTYFKKSNKLVVFYNGAVDVAKTPPPVFQRWSWFKKMPYSCMIFMDPTIYELIKENDENTYIGWYQGNQKIFVLKKLLKIVKNVSKRLGIDYSDIVFYGSSAGGFASLMSAGMLKGSKACVVNPQVNVLEYYKRNVDILMKYLHIDKDEPKERRYTLDVIEYYKYTGYFPEVYYKQNRQDSLHYEKHFKYLRKNYKEFHMNKKLKTVLTDDLRGHSAIPLFDEVFLDIEQTFGIF